jgi:hypothetical protein
MREDGWQWGIRQGLPSAPAKSYERLYIRTASGILPSITQEVVKLSLLSTVEECIEFL